MKSNDLDFQESLQNTTTTILCNRLKTLRGKLREMNQHDLNKDSFKKIIPQLHNLVGHRDKYVKILASCCIADLLGLFAPDAPFTNSQLKQIFQLYYRQLKILADPNHVHFSLAFELLETISNTDQIVLFCHLDQDDLITSLASDFIELKASSTVQVHLRTILQLIIESLNTIPDSFVDLLLNNMNKMTIELCDLCSDKLQRCVVLYFSNRLVNSVEELDDLKKLHELILKIFENCPKLLLNVVPLLEEELKVENQTIRQIACTCLGVMFSQKGNRWIEFYPHVWKSWTERRHDKISVIRLEWVEYLGTIIKLDPTTIGFTEQYLVEKLADPDHKVRSCAIKVCGEISISHVDLLSSNIIKELGTRCRDKNQLCRQEAIVALSKLFNLHPGRYVDFPTILLNLLYLGDEEVNIVVERCLADYIFPKDELPAKTKRLVEVYAGLDERAKNAFHSVLSKMNGTSKNFGTFLEKCLDKQRDEEILDKIIDFLCQRLPDPKRGHEAFKKFLSLKDRRLYQIMQKSMNPKSDYQDILKYKKDVKLTLEKHSVVNEILSIYINRTFLVVINKNIIENLLETMQSKSDLSATAELLIRNISKFYPDLYKTQIQNFCTLIQNGTNLDETIQALAHGVKVFPDEFPKSGEIVQVLLNLALSGNLVCSQSATLVLSKCGYENECKQILQLSDNLTTDFEELVPKLGSLLALSYHNTLLYNQRNQEIKTFIITQILMKNQERDSEQDWVEFNELKNESKAKILGLKILVKPLLVEKNDQIAMSVVKLLKTIILNDGELLKDESTSSATKSHLRLVAGKSLLKLAQNYTIDILDLHLLGYLVQDSIYNVRNLFIAKLCKYIACKKLTSKFVNILVLSAVEPDSELHDKVRSFIIRTSKEFQKGTTVEQYFAHFIHLLAHHSDFSQNHTDLLQFESYINFYLETICNQDNISLLYYISLQLKTIQDKHGKSTNLYIVSELCQLIIREHAAEHNWLLTTYPDKIGISRELFEKLDHNEATENSKKIYLEEIGYSKTRGKKPKQVVRKREKDDEDKENKKKRKEKEVQTPTRKSTRQRKVVSPMVEVDSDEEY
ncbi:hypothetical protein HDV06_000642 [Boothiomyces sp. JEL0866]|nr:hypothetical protein HDV06_000642 [Boothiomyces sp. JEL0866]